MTKPMISNTYQRSSNAEAFEVEGEWVILHADQYTVTKLNEVGGLIWSMLKAAQSPEALADSLLNVYDITKQEAERDVEAFLGNLLRLGLIEYASK